MVNVYDEHLFFIFRAATGESWHLVMKDCFDQALCESRAGQGPDAKCGNTAASIIYFCSFYFLCSFLVSHEFKYCTNLGN